MLQALRAVAHNYPSIMIICWDEVSSVVSRFLSPVTSQPPTLSAKSSTGHTASAVEEKIIAAAVKVILDHHNAVALVMILQIMVVMGSLLFVIVL